MTFERLYTCSGCSTIKRIRVALYADLIPTFPHTMGMCMCGGVYKTDNVNHILNEEKDSMGASNWGHRERLARDLREKVVPKEKANKQAKEASTEEIIHRLSTRNLTPALSDVEVEEYMKEAERRLYDV